MIRTKVVHLDFGKKNSLHLICDSNAILLSGVSVTCLIDLCICVWWLAFRFEPTSSSLPLTPGITFLLLRLLLLVVVFSFLVHVDIDSVSLLEHGAIK